MFVKSRKEKSLKDFLISFLIGIPLIILAFLITEKSTTPIRQTIHNIIITIPNKGVNTISFEVQGKVYHAICVDDNFCNPHKLKNTTIQDKYEGKNIKFLMIRHTSEENGFIIQGDFYEKATSKHYRLLTNQTQMNKSIRNDFIVLAIAWLFALGTIGSGIIHFITFLKEDY